MWSSVAEKPRIRPRRDDTPGARPRRPDNLDEPVAGDLTTADLRLLNRDPAHGLDRVTPELEDAHRRTMPVGPGLTPVWFSMETIASAAG
jgi:hypothetical protein